MINLRVIIGLIFFLIVFFFYKVQNRPEKIMNQTVKETMMKVSKKSDEKKMLPLTNKSEKAKNQKPFLVSGPSPVWEEDLKETLLVQAGGLIKNIKIKSVDSFIWKQDGVAMQVESVIISFLNEDNQETKFRALVDPQNGKILRNWDQPIVDPGNPRDSFKIKIDPRYHNEN